MESLKTLANNTTQVVKFIFSKDEPSVLDKHYQSARFEKKPDAYKSINSSSIIFK